MNSGLRLDTLHPFSQTIWAKRMSMCTVCTWMEIQSVVQS